MRTHTVKWTPVRDYEEMSRMAAQHLYDTISQNLAQSHVATTGMATGNTMIRLYALLAEKLNKAGLGLAGYSTFNLDEYVGSDGRDVPPTHPLSYRKYMTEYFFDLVDPKLGFKRENMFFPDASKPERIDKQIDDAGGVDIQLLGIGFNGHIAFNEPIPACDISEKAFASLPSRVIQLNELTIQTNARLTAGGDLSKVPLQAVTLGMKPILMAKKILLLACFKEQVAPLAKIKAGEISTENPASFLLGHPSVEVIYTADTINL